MRKLIILLIAILFFSCETTTTEPQNVITDPLADRGGTPGKPDKPDKPGDGGTIGYCVTVEYNTDECTWTSSSSPPFTSPEGMPGMGRWPNLASTWYPTSENTRDPDFEYYAWVVFTSDGSETVLVSPNLTVHTRKGNAIGLRVNLRDVAEGGSYRRYYGYADGDFPVANVDELKTPEDGLRIHVHQEMELLEVFPTGKGNKFTTESMGTIAIGDIVFNIDDPEGGLCRWPQ